MITAGATAKIGEGVYTAADAARILNIPYPKANYWFKYYLKKKHFKTDYRYYFQVKDILAVNFLSLIEMSVFYSFKEKGVKIGFIVEAHKTLSDLYKTPYPFATNDFYVKEGKVWFGDKNLVATADKNLQIAFPEILIPLSEKITFSDDKLAHKYYPLGKEKTVVVNPEHQFGQPTIEGTNILAAIIYNLYLGKEKKEFIAELYNITTQNVEDAIEFCTLRKAA